MNDTADPWKDITPPDHSQNVSARRVDPSLPWGIFWAVDTDNNCLLILNHDPVNKPQSRLPRLKGLSINAVVPGDDGKSILSVRLIEKEQREIFHRLCLDIVSATAAAQTEEEAIDRFLARTWRWHRLLRGGTDSRLSDQEQKGLLGELTVLREILAPAVGVADAVKAWTGPMNTPKDFELGRLCIEAKAHRGAATPYVIISTEHQLDLDGIDNLFLYVSEVASAGENDRGSETVTSLSETIRKEIEDEDPSVVQLFEERLAATGFDWVDDYSDKSWLIGPAHVFEVRDQFPRVSATMLEAGVSNVRYSISLSECTPYQVNHDYLKDMIQGGGGAD